MCASVLYTHTVYDCVEPKTSESHDGGYIHLLCCEWSECGSWWSSRLCDLFRGRVEEKRQNESSDSQSVHQGSLVGCKGTAGWHYIVNFTSTKAHNAILLHDIVMIMIISQCRGYTL